MNVLIIENSRFHQRMISQIFNNEELTVHIANNGDAALEILENKTVDYICTAYHLPDGFDGIKLAQLIRTNPKTKDIPIVLLTSNDIDHSFDYAYHSGVTEIYNRSDIDLLSKNLKRSILAKQNVINARVLYIEDCKTDAAIIKRKLEAMKMSVEHYFNAAEALKAFQESTTNYDIIITDLLVEGSISGMGLIREVRKMIPDRSKMPILVTSGFNDNSRRIELLHMGANEYIVKPIIAEELAAQITNLVSTKQLFDQVKIQQEQLFQLAMTDQLTGLYNRHSLAKLLPKYFSHSVRHSSPLSLLLLDIDHFKRINDTYGHSKGDDVLRKFAQLITVNFRAEDLIARYGGEEFVVLMDNSSKEDAIEKANALRTYIENTPIEDIKITISIGVASTTNNSNFEILFNQADTALYHAKENGRNQTITYPLKMNIA